MDKTKDGSSSMNRQNEGKTATLVWRPVSTESASHEESLECRTISLSEMAIHEERVQGESLIDSVTKLDAEVANKVSKLSVPLEVDASLIRFVKGKWGSTQKRIEEATGVTIIFPSSKEESCLILEGISDESVAKASKLIASVLDEVVKSPKLDYSHFISLPLAIYPELTEKLQNFQNNVLGSTSGFDGNPELADSSDPGIEKSIFIKPKTFHLTVLMLKLWNKDLVASAAEVLQKISSKVNDALGNRPVSVKLEGLECMQESPAKARVLYAPVKEIGAEGRLLRACQVIREAYVEEGLVLEKDARQALKLHATIMNERHRKWNKWSKRRDSFDARWILRRYGSLEWGDYVIREAHLSRILSLDESGYYHCCASIPFPKSMDA